MHTGLIKSATEEAEHKGLWQLLTGSARYVKLNSHTITK